MKCLFNNMFFYAVKAVWTWNGHVENNLKKNLCSRSLKSCNSLLHELLDSSIIQKWSSRYPHIEKSSILQMFILTQLIIKIKAIEKYFPFKYKTKNLL